MFMKERSPFGIVRAPRLSLIALVAVLMAGCSGPVADWPQWGGPDRNFAVEVNGLADKWPDNGPKQLWSRELGDGYATIIAVDGLLYTMYRRDEDEFTVALDAKTGKTIWEHRNPSPFTQLMAQFGPGPHSTPLVVADRLYTIGTNTVMHCYDRRTGKILWTHDLANEFDAPIPGRGYGSSPIAYKNTVIVSVGRKQEDDQGESTDDDETKSEKKVAVDGQALIAFDQMTGKVVWKSQDFRIGYSSPVVINFHNQEQLLVFTTTDLVGLDPANGSLLWKNPHKTQYGANISTPLWNGEDLIFCSAAYGSGSRVVRLTRKDGKTVPEELWHSRKMRVHHGNVIRIGDHIYGSSGDVGPAFFMAMNLETGKIAWRERGFKKATCVYGDGKVIILDEDGQLALATATPDGLTVHSKCKVAEPYSWAAPTLVGTTLYVRDRKHIMAFDLG